MDKRIMPDKISSLFKSRRFWAGVLTMVLPLINDKLNLQLSNEDLDRISNALLAWILADSVSKTGAADFFFGKLREKVQQPS